MPPPEAGGREALAAQLWEDSRLAFKRKDYRTAADLLARLVEDCGEAAGPLGAAGTRLTLGVALLRLGDTGEGVVHLRRALELDPGVARTHQKLGAGLARLGREAEALPYFEKAVELAPDNAEYHWRLGEQRRRLKDFEGAARALERSLELEPGYFRALDLRDRLEADLKGAWPSRLLKAVRRG